MAQKNLTLFKKYSYADCIGIANSAICLVHCTATPLLIALGVGFMHNPIFKFLFLSIAFISIFTATKNTKNKKIVLFLWLSFIGFSLSNLFEETHKWIENAGFVFAVLVVVGHAMNIKHCRLCAIQKN